MSTSITKIIVIGAAGRMGSRICELALQDPRLSIVAALEQPGAPSIGRRVLAGNHAENAPIIADSTDEPADVVIDFSSPKGALAALSVAVRSNASLLVGTTGISSTSMQSLRAAAADRAVLVAPNTSLGVAAVADAAARLAAALGPEFKVSIVESHHIHKKDAPSGTAIRLAAAVRAALPDPAHQLPDDQIFSIRAGDIVGDHTIRFAGPGEVIDLTHRATTRDVFALGALRAALWLHGRGPGWWTIEDVIGFARS